MSLRSIALGRRSYLSTGALVAAILFSLATLRMLFSLANTHHLNAGHDFRILYAAAVTLRLHQNPYDPAVLLPHIIATGLPRLFLVDANGVLNQPYVYPPIFAWFVIPLTYLSPTRALLVWRILSALCVFAGTLGLTAAWNSTSGLRPFGSRTHQVLLAALLVCSPVAVYVYYWGNPTVLVYAAMGGWSWLLTRNRPLADTLAGVVMTLALLKPQLALPLAALATFSLIRGPGATTRRWCIARAFGVACVALLGLSALLVGPTLLLDWPRSVAYLSGMIYTQPDMPSLIGLLRPILVLNSPRVQTAALYGVMLLGGAVVIWLYRKLRDRWMPTALLALLTVIWCFATPYAHANDVLLMVPGGLALVLALISVLGELVKAHRHEWPSAWLGIVSRWAIQAAISALALWLLWRGGVLYYQHFLALSIPQLPLVPLLLLLGFAANWLYFGHQEHEVYADSSAYAYRMG
jgi:Glycosyltransferase family 87